MVTLSIINGMQEDGENDVSASLVNEFKIKTKRECSLRENMIFLPSNNR